MSISGTVNCAGGELKDYPEKLRRIRQFDPATTQELVILNNHFNRTAPEVAEVYCGR